MVYHKNYKYQIWIDFQTDQESKNDELTKKELSLIKVLRHKGNWQSELIKFGFN